MKSPIAVPKFLRKSSPVFKYFPQLDEVNYTGSSFGEKIMMFQTMEGTQKGELVMMSIIRKEESELWQACRGLIIDILTSVEPRMVGIFKFQLLSIAMSEDMERFQWKEFSDGIRDLGREIPIGQSRFVQYCSLLGILSKHAIEDEARIMFDPHVQILEREPEELDDALERLIKLDRKEATLSGKRRFVFYDLSKSPLYNRSHEEQGRRLQRLSRKMDSFSSTSLNEVFIIDNNGCHSLFVKSQMEMELF